MGSERWLTRRPVTFVVALVWPTSTPSRDALWVILSMLRPELRMDQIFKTEHNTEDQTSSIAQLQSGVHEEDQPTSCSQTSPGSLMPDAQAAHKRPSDAGGNESKNTEQTYMLRGLICYYG